MDINRRTLTDLYIAYSAAFQRGLRSQEDAQAWQRIATKVPSSTGKNGYPWLGQWPKLKEWLDERTVKSLKAHKYEIENRDFESTVGVERNAIQDDEYMVYAPMFEEMGVAAAEWPSDVAFEALKANGVCYDGKAFFASDHPHKKDGAVSNVDSSGSGASWYLLDVSRVLKPLIWQPRQAPKLVRKDRDDDDEVFNNKRYVYGVDARGNAGYGLWQLAYRSNKTLDETNYVAARKALMEMTNDEGSSLGVRPGLLVVPPELEIPARKLVQASQNAQGATNVIAGTAEVYVTNLVA